MLLRIGFFYHAAMHFERIAAQRSAVVKTCLSQSSLSLFSLQAKLLEFRVFKLNVTILRLYMTTRMTSFQRRFHQEMQSSLRSLYLP